jgi:hypothetical protein
MNSSLSGFLEFDVSHFISWKNSVAIISAQEKQLVGWPEPAWVVIMAISLRRVLAILEI